MATKRDFTKADKEKYNSIIGANDTKDTKRTKETRISKNQKYVTPQLHNISKTIKATKKYANVAKEDLPEEYRFTVRMPGDYGRFLNELAYQRRSTITAEFTRLVAEEMEKHPEILESLDELND